jgi:hypothetical protein
MDGQCPTLDPGVTYLDDEGAPTALYRVVGRRLSAATEAYWLDALNAAVPTAIREHAPGRTSRSLRVARAFTGYQHYELARSLPAAVTGRTDLVVAPNVGALYADGDVPEHEADTMVEATLALLGELADALALPVVLTATEYRDRVRSVADRTVEAERTRAGLRFDGESVRTDVYWHKWGFQTTIPYWVDLLGASESEPVWTEPEAVVPGV